MTTISAVSGRELDQILARQRSAFLRDGPPSLKQRRADLKKLRAAILARRTEIERALDADFGHRSRHETATLEMVSVVLSIDYLHRNLHRFMAPTRRHVAMAFRFASARIEYQPLGVIGIIATWNYPFQLAVMGSPPPSPPATGQCSSCPSSRRRQAGSSPACWRTHSPKNRSPW